MLHLLVLGICLIIGLGLLGYWLLNTEPAKLRRVLKWVLILAGVGLAVALLVRGSGSFLWTAALLLVPLVLRWRNIARHFRNAAKTAAGPSPGQSSAVRTEFLEMTLDHDSGAMDGVVTQGRQSGRRLDDLSLENLLDLLEECQSDPQSAQLLESFIDRVHGDDWRFGHQRQAGGGGGGNSGGLMSRAQALEILGLGDSAKEQEIRSAHRRLMLANHPDRGGSTFLAAQINQAKEVLLGAS
jgi:hypothetical protein